MEPVSRHSEVEYTNSKGETIEAYYLGISYQGSFDTSTYTRIMVIRKDTGKIVEVYPTKITFK